MLDREGRYLGPMQMPAEFQPFQVTGGKVVGRWTDEVDVEFGRVYGVGGEAAVPARPSGFIRGHRDELETAGPVELDFVVPVGVMETTVGIGGIEICRLELGAG